jgi:hypothetical protein
MERPVRVKQRLIGARVVPGVVLFLGWGGISAALGEARSNPR